VAGAAEAGDRCGIVCSGLIGFDGGPTNDVNANQVFSWRKRYREASDQPSGASAPQLIPVVVTADRDAVAEQASSIPETIEIDVAGKYRVRVGCGFDGPALRRVLDVLERR
jgi:transposase